MADKTFEHVREITLDRDGPVVRLILEAQEAEISPAADQFAKDLAATLSMYTRRLSPFPGEVRVALQPGGKAAAETDPASSPLMEQVRPRFTLDEFVCEPHFRHILDDVLFYAGHFQDIRTRMGVEPVTRCFLVNFFGESGTGKTMAAEAFASALGKDLFVMNFANVESSLVGRTPKNIALAFRAIDPAQAIIMLDEADAFVSRRIADLRQGAEYALNAARGQIISELDRFDGMVILATNLFGTYDNAILRRIKFNLQFELPGHAAAETLFRRFLSRAQVTGLDFAALAAASAGLSGGDIYNISEIIVMKSLQQQDRGGALDPAEIDRIIDYYRTKTRHLGIVPAAGQEN